MILIWLSVSQRISCSPKRFHKEFKGLEINRLSTWSVVQMSVTIVDIGHGQSHLMQPESSLTACRLELDINTAKEFEGRLTKVALPKLLEEFSELALEISKKGDVP